MEHHQSVHGQNITIFLVSLCVIIIVSAFYLSFIRKNKEAGGH